ncbi:MAG: hypothetical protein IT446_14940 [Phycisphaerales bacterium]|nr:hypothetical protein [Phycisphaerales bacterium]
MNAHQFLSVGVAAMMIVAGCGSSEKTHDQPSTALLSSPSQTPLPQRHPPQAPEDVPPEEPHSAELLKRRTEKYAQEMRQQMEQHAAPPRQQPESPANPPATAPAPQPRQTPPTAQVPPAPPAPPALPASPVPSAEANQPAVTPQPPSSPAPTGSADANSPAAVPQTRELTTPPPATPADALMAKLAQRIRDNPRDVASHLDYQLLRFVQNESVPDLSALASLPAEDRELVSAVMDGLSNFRSTLRSDNNMLLSRKVKPLLDLSDRLRTQTDLTIGAIALCTKVEGFGIYDAIEPARFAAGREHPAIIYCQIENFASQFNEQKQWETRLTMESVLYTESGLNVWSDKTTPIVDRSRQRRHDFFVVRMVRIPANLTIGRYLLKVTLVDQQASRVAEATLPIQVVAQ